MPRIKITTQVNADVATVSKGFTEALFMQLSPPFPPVKLLRFDGCQTADEVIIQLNFILFTQEWHSLITGHNQSVNYFDFIDEGLKLPWPLKKWRHHHIVTQNDKEQTSITDDIHYRTSNWLMDMLIYPLLWLQFAYRKPIYRRVFG
jgi:ligand-binding SRPBCC domain-containing protein